MGGRACCSRGKQQSIRGRAGGREGGREGANGSDGEGEEGL